MNKSIIKELKAINNDTAYKEGFCPEELSWKEKEEMERYVEQEYT